jgi:hypothetical protein
MANNYDDPYADKPSNAERAAELKLVKEPGMYKKIAPSKTKSYNQFGAYMSKNESRAHKMLATKLGNMERMRTAADDPKRDDTPFDPDPPRKNPVAKAGKYGQGYSIARHLARQAMNSVKESDELDEANGPPKATLAFARKQALAAALHNFKKGMANDDLSKFKTDLNKKKTANEETELDEASRAETGELFKSLLDRAVSASDRGDHAQAKRHLANAQTARYGILAKHIPKHADNFAKYKELKNNYMNEAKDEREYGYEGEMAITQLKTIGRHADNLLGMMQPDTDLPEWVQSKITLATDYMQTAHDYLMSEMNESLDEAADKEHPIYKEYQALKQQDIKSLRDQIKRQHRIVDTSEFRTKEHAISHILNNKHGNKRVVAALGESVEQMNELSKGTLSSYASKANQDALYMRQDAGHTAGAERAELKLKAARREAGVKMADRKMSKEDFDYWDAELAEIDEAMKTVKTDDKGNVVSWSQEGDWVKSAGKKQGTGKAANLAGQALQATKKLAKEETELDEANLHSYTQELIKTNHPDHKIFKHATTLKGDAYKKYAHEQDTDVRDKLLQYVKEDALDEVTSPMQKLRQAHDRHMEKALAANRAGDDVAVKVHQNYMQKLTARMSKLKQMEAWSIGNRNNQRSIQVGHKVRSYDFPGMHDSHYIEGHVVSQTPSSYHIKVNKVVRDNKEIPIPSHMHHVEAPKGRSIWNDAVAVHKINEAAETVDDEKAVKVANPTLPAKGAARTFASFKARMQK